jgi:superfamily II DNA or RNA helicase
MGTKPEIIILDSVHCKANPSAKKLIEPLFTSKQEIWDRWNHVPSFKTVSTFLPKNLFLTGMLPAVRAYCRKQGIEIEVKGEEEKIRPDTMAPVLPDITFRPDQLKAIRRGCRKGRGLIVFPTGTGKTIIALGLFLCFKSAARLFLCHTNDLYTQTLDELNRFKFKNVFAFSSKSNWNEIRKTKNPIVVAKIQSFAKADPKNYSDFIDMTIVDEVHHVNSIDSQYGKILQSMISPLRIGFSATLHPKGSEKALITEGFFGPIIAKMNNEKGIEIGIIATAKIQLEAVPYELEVKKKSKNKFTLTYEHGIVLNRTRNKIITELSKASYNESGVVLIIVEAIKHGKIIQRDLRRLIKMEVPFVHGEMKPAARKQFKEQMKNSKQRIVICSRVWKEGINIPSITHIINAAGMKDEKGVIQALGRGLRTAQNKNELLLTDFLDPYRYLAEHAIARIQIYKREGWL